MTYTNPVLAASLLMAASAASALTISVPDPGNSIATPSQAIAIAQPGDVIEISGTSYTEALVVTISNLTLRGMGPTPVAIVGPSGPDLIGGPSTAGGNAITVSSATGVVLENLSLTGGDGGTEGTNSNRTGHAGGAGLRCLNATVSLTGCTLQGGEGGTGVGGFPLVLHGGGGTGLTADAATVTATDCASNGGLDGSGTQRNCAYRLLDNATISLAGTTPAPTDPPTCVEAGSQLLSASGLEGWSMY